MGLTRFTLTFITGGPSGDDFLFAPSSPILENFVKNLLSLALPFLFFSCGLIHLFVFFPPLLSLGGVEKGDEINQCVQPAIFN